MKDIVLIISHPKDIHADVVSATLERNHGIRTQRLCMDRFPLDSLAAFRLGAKRNTLFLSANETIDLDSVKSIWWRRPNTCIVPPFEDESTRIFAENESTEFLEGLLWRTDCLWINDPACDRMIDRKVFQLELAVSVGLIVPETLITNDPAKAHAFIKASQDRVIHKRTGTGTRHSTKTRVVTSEDMTRLGSIRYAPTTFQRYVEGVYDLRITYIGGTLWPVAIHSQAGNSPEDCRFDNTVPFEVVKLPQEVTQKLSRLVRNAGLEFAAIDMRLGTDGLYYFFEINPRGQFWFVQLKTGLPLAGAMASLLAKSAS